MRILIENSNFVHVNLLLQIKETKNYKKINLKNQRKKEKKSILNSDNYLVRD